MGSVECIRSQLVAARRVSEGLLADFRTPEQWTHQVHGNANHALWFAGHMGVLDNYFISNIDPSLVEERPLYAETFGLGSTPTNNPVDYPDIPEVLDYMRERRATLLGLLDGMADEDLTTKTIHGTPDFASDYAALFHLAIWHEGLHSGQVSVARRALGHKPLLNEPATAG